MFLVDEFDRDDRFRLVVGHGFAYAVTVRSADVSNAGGIRLTMHRHLALLSC